MSTWPAELPQSFEQDGYDEQWVGNNVVQTDMDVGPVFSRARSRVKIKSISGTMVLDSAQVDALDNFYADTLIFGTQKFQWVQPRNPAATVSFQFDHSGGAPYSVSNDGGDVYTVQFKMFMYL